MEGAEPSAREGEKKSPFDAMDRDQLIKKCKGLLGIAQMAKKAKDELSSENIHLKEIVSQYETKTVADKECMRTMKEMVDSLTEHKLSTANKSADWERHCESLKVKLRDYEQLSIENEGMKRQIVRLTDENDEQAMDLKRLDDKLEQVNRLSQQQNDELLILEQSVNRWKEMEVDHKRLQEDYGKLEAKCAELEGLRTENKECKNAYNQMMLLHEKTMEDFEKVSREMHELQQKLLATSDRPSVREQELVEENRALKEELEQQAAELDSSKCRLERVIEENQGNQKEAEEKCEQLQCKYEESLRSSEELQAANDAEKRSIGEKLSTMNKIENELQVCLNAELVKIDELNAQLNEKLSEIDQLRLEVNSIKSAANEQSSLVTDFEQLQSEVVRYKNQIKELEINLDNRQKKYDSLNSVHVDLQSELAKLTENSKALENRNKALTQEVVILRKNEDELRALRIEFDNKNREIVESNAIQNELAEENKRLISKALEAKSECLTCTQLRAQIEEKNAEIQQYHTQLGEAIASKEAELQSCNRTINEMDDANEALKNRIMSLQQELEIAKSADSEESDKFQHLLTAKEAELVAIQKKLNDSADAKTTRIKILEDQLKETTIERDQSNAQLAAMQATDCTNCQQLLQQIAQYQSVRESLEKTLADRQARCDELKIRVDELEIEADRKDGKIAELQSEQEECLLKFDKLINQLESIKKIFIGDSEALDQSSVEIHSKIEASINECTALKEQLAEKVALIEILQKEQADRVQLVADTESQKENILSQLNECLEEIEHLKKAECQQCVELRTRIDVYTTECESLRSSLADSETGLQQRSIRLLELEKTDELMKKKNDDLLVEMREINEALKNRGDIISKQNREIADLQSSLEISANRSRELDEEVKQKIAAVEKLTTSIREYESRANDNFGDNQSEILSTSTISRAEESARMRDIEDSFEDKYNKLRGLAIKLKRKVAEQTATIAKLDADNTKNASESGNLKIQNLMALQAEHDKLMDKIDKVSEENSSLKKSVKQLKEELEQSMNEIKALKSVVDETKLLADTNLKNKLAVDQALQDALKKNKSLRGDADKLAAAKKSLEEEISKLKDENTGKAAEIKAQKAELNKIKASMKKNNVLNLEMEAYEKSLKEVSQKLETQTMRVTELESSTKSLENTVDAQKNQIRILEESLKSEKQHSVELKQEVDMQLIRIKESEHEKCELKIRIDESQKENNSLKLEIADVRQELSQYTVDKEKLITSLQSEGEKNIRQLFAFEDEIRNLKARLNDADQELVNVKTEYASYKVRAQSVLRQNQSKDSSNEDELKEELTSVLKSKENLTAKLTAAVEQSRHIQNLLNEANQDKENLKLRCKELLQLLDESRRQGETQQEESRKQLQENNEALKMQRVQIDTLNSCYKNQISELEAKHTQEILLLKTAIKETDNKCKAAIEQTRGHPLHQQLHQNHLPLSDEQRIELILTERQEGEGSESTASMQNAVQRKHSTARGKRELIPLDELLSTSFDDNDLITTSVEEERPISPTIELRDTKEKLNVQETRVRHLSTLLSEAEMDVARLTQLNDVLKEEVRRQERSTEREKHMHNLEYIKNIIFKFLTINNADERAHLVPVLNTILKLSPDEANHLQTVARGADTSQRGWSNILPMW